MKRKDIARILILAFLIILTTSSATYAQAGKIEWARITFPSLEGNLLGDSATRSVGIYTPPGYEDSEKLYPSVYFLHGYGGNPGAGAGIFKPPMDSMIRNGSAVETWGYIKKQ